MRIILIILHLLFFLLPASLCAQAPVCNYKLIREFSHDSQAFTQGFAFDSGFLYEGTGLYGQSSLRRMSLDGQDFELRPLPNLFFGEGVTVLGEKIFQLTWKSRTGLVWDKHSLSFLHFFSYTTEGWGLTDDGTSLILSDGSSSLFYLDPVSFTLQRTIPVSDNGVPVDQLNELEYIKGEIWANIWQQNRIAIIDPQTGRVRSWVDFSALIEKEKLRHRDNVLNGIAYDVVQDRIFITGKRWPKIFEIKVLGEAAGN